MTIEPCGILHPLDTSSDSSDRALLIKCMEFMDFDMERVSKGIGSTNWDMLIYDIKKHIAAPAGLVETKRCEFCDDTGVDAELISNSVELPVPTYINDACGHSREYYSEGQLREAAKQAVEMAVSKVLPVAEKALNEEQQYVVKEAHRITIGEEYFNARPTLMTPSHVRAFDDGFNRGYGLAMQGNKK